MYPSPDASTSKYFWNICTHSHPDVSCKESEGKTWGGYPCPFLNARKTPKFSLTYLASAKYHVDCLLFCQSTFPSPGRLYNGNDSGHSNFVFTRYFKSFYIEGQLDFGILECWSSEFVFPSKKPFWMFDLLSGTVLLIEPSWSKLVFQKTKPRPPPSLERFSLIESLFK